LSPPAPSFPPNPPNRRLSHEPPLESVGGEEAGELEHPSPTVVGDIGNVEAGNLQVRLIALENLFVALLAGAPESQSALVREMAAYISPRPGTTPHRLTVEAASNILAIVERAANYKMVESNEL